MKWYKRFKVTSQGWFRLGISVFLLLLFIIHNCYHDFKLYNYSIFYIVAILFVLFSKYKLKITSLKIAGILEFEFDNIDTAQTFVPYDVNSEEGSIEIKWNQKKREERDYQDNMYLSFDARIFYPKEAGGNYLLKIFVNNVLIEPSRLINKPIVKENIDGRKFSWYNEDYESWLLCYSPDFITNYLHKTYKVIGGDPYKFIFKIGDIEPKNKNKYIISFQHNGRSEKDSLRNSIIIKNIELKRCTNLVN